MAAKRRTAILATGALAAGASALVLTGGVAAGHPAQKASTVTVKASGHSESSLHYNSIVAHTGDTLKIVDATPAPHTFSLIDPKLIPHSGNGFKHCFDPGNACRDIATWHKLADNHIHENPVHAGGRGWDTEGSSAKKEGDSVVFTPGKFPKSRVITAPSGTTLHFMCAIHPFMQGTIKVK